MKNKKILIGVCIGIFIVLCTTFTVRNTEETKNETINQIESQNSKKKELVQIYNDDELINIFLNKYNEVYSNEQITSEMLSVYNHHGSNHKDQVQVTIKDMQITLTSNSYSKKLSVYIENEANNDNDNILRELTKRFVKLFNQEITDEQIEDHLNNLGSGSDIQTYENIEYLTNKGLNNIIQYIKLTGELK